MPAKLLSCERRILARFILQSDEGRAEMIARMERDPKMSGPLPNDRCIHPSGPHPQNEFCAWRTPKTKGVME